LVAESHQVDLIENPVDPSGQSMLIFCDISLGSESLKKYSVMVFKASFITQTANILLEYVLKTANSASPLSFKYQTS